MTQLVQVNDYRFVQEAETAKMFMEEAGITAFLEDVETVSMDWLLGNAVGYIKLVVPEDQVEEARKILREMEQTKSEPPAQASANACLACGEEMGEESERCPHCGWTWKPETSQFVADPGV